MGNLVSGIDCSLDISGFGVKIYQPKVGFRFSMDSVLLGEFINRDISDRPQKILDIGVGVGAALLHAIRGRKSDIVFGIDRNEGVLEICGENFRMNGHELPNLVLGDIRDFPLKSELFDIVLTNPPFYRREDGRISRTKNYENHETVALDIWIRYCLKRLRQKGILYMVHIPARLSDILGCLRGFAGGIEVIPIQKEGADRAKRVIVKCVKDSRSPLVLRSSIYI